MTQVDAVDVLAGARNLVDSSGIVGGTRVVIHTHSDPASQEVVASLWEASSDVGASVAVVTTQRWDKNSEPPPEAFERAVEGADVLVSVGEYLRTLENLYLRRAIYDRGLVYIHNEATTAEALGSWYGRLPMEILAAIGDYVAKQIATAQELRITTSAGTDMRMRVSPSTVGGYWYPFHWDLPGHKKGFPGGAFCFHPEGPVEGVMAFEAIPPQAHPPQVLLDSPLLLTFEDQRVVAVEGEHAQWLDAYWDRNGDENSRWLGKVMWGIHPRAQSPGARGASNPAILTVGLGNSVPYGGPVFSKSWVRGQMQDATVRADGEVVLDSGRLAALDAEPVRRLAADLGVPGEALAQAEESLTRIFGRG